MRIPNAEHESRPWRIREIAHDFELEDVWALPASGGAKDFPILLDVMRSFDPAGGESVASRFLFRVRESLGKWFGWDDDAGELAIPGAVETSLADRLPEDLRGTATDVDFGSLPFEPVYCTDDELAAEVSNQTVHAVLHLGWVDEGNGRYQGQMAIYVKPRGLLGHAYMNLIRPFRYWIVYPALLRRIERGWKSRLAAKERR